MKTKTLLLSLLFLATISITYAQDKKKPQSIISSSATIKKYYSLKELESLKKGELLDLYIERINVLVRTLPYIALATKPGVTLVDLGIPYDNDNKKTLSDQEKVTTEFLETTVEFQRKMTPYSDTKNLIAAILFYENTLKALHEFNEM